MPPNPVMQKNFDCYRIEYIARSAATGDHVASIECHVGNSLAASTLAGRMHFYDGTSFPQNGTYLGCPELYFPTSRFNDIIQILRYEKPLGLYLNTETHVGFLYTSAEPIGEQEPPGS